VDSGEATHRDQDTRRGRLAHSRVRAPASETGFYIDALYLTSSDTRRLPKTCAAESCRTRVTLNRLAKSRDAQSAPILFEAALPQRTAFTLDGEGEATLKLIVPEQFAKVLSDNIHRLRHCSFVVRLEGLEH